MQLGEMDLEAAAKAAAGNWKHFQCFAWHREQDVPDADQWYITYTHHRDSGLLDQSNAAVVEAALDTFTHGKSPDVVPEHHSHWVCGWVAGLSIRVYRGHRITKAFRAYHALVQRLADYPVLDTEDYSRRETEATLKNITGCAWRLKPEHELPEDWQSEIYDWLDNNDPAAIEDTDDRGGYPSEEQLRAAFEALGYQQTVAV